MRADEVKAVANGVHLALSVKNQDLLTQRQVVK